ncbi:hypothetical protein BC832DRAFT_132057 [Gaertneriomyces semiglobifer]|nr:hypothetical protein BC832DRAFT_132057 [Gaertneriomyces semiglobifer]
MSQNKPSDNRAVYNVDHERSRVVIPSECRLGGTFHCLQRTYRIPYHSQNGRKQRPAPDTCTGDAADNETAHHSRSHHYNCIHQPCRRGGFSRCMHCGSQGGAATRGDPPGIAAAATTSWPRSAQNWYLFRCSWSSKHTADVTSIRKHKSKVAACDSAP